MSYGNSSLANGAWTYRRSHEFGRTHVVKPKGRHQATIVWLHGLGDNGLSCSQHLETLPLPNIKWICPTAPTRPVAIFGGFSCTTWFDVGDLSEEGPDDVEGMDASAAHIANLLSTEPANTKLGIGGFSTGAAMALYSASCCTHGQFGNGNPYPINVSAVVALSGWLPRSRSLKSMVESSQDGIRRAASLPILMCQGRGFRHTSMMELSKADRKRFSGDDNDCDETSLSKAVGSSKSYILFKGQLMKQRIMTWRWI